MRIKRLNEQYFSQSYSGDGYNSSNGVFKVSYKPYDDLSITRGRDVIPSQYIKGEGFQVGDLVKGKVKGSEAPIEGIIVSMIKNNDASEFHFQVKSTRSNSVYPVITATLQMVQDNGYSSFSRSALGGSGEKMAMNMKYNAGNLIWGRLESQGSEKFDILLTNNGEKAMRKGKLDNSLSLSVVGHDDSDVDKHKENFRKLGIAYLDTAARTIYIDGTHPDFSKLTDDHLLTIEAHELAHNLIKDSVKDDVEIICDLVAAKILRNKGYNSPYKIIVSNFLGRHSTSYGEELDYHQKTLNGILK